MRPRAWRPDSRSARRCTAPSSRRSRSGMRSFGIEQSRRRDFLRQESTPYRRADRDDVDRRVSLGDGVLITSTVRDEMAISGHTVLAAAGRSCCPPTCAIAPPMDVEGWFGVPIIQPGAVAAEPVYRSGHCTCLRAGSDLTVELHDPGGQALCRVMEGSGEDDFELFFRAQEPSVAVTVFRVVGDAAAAEELTQKAFSKGGAALAAAPIRPAGPHQDRNVWCLTLETCHDPTARSATGRLRQARCEADTCNMRTTTADPGRDGDDRHDALHRRTRQFRVSLGCSPVIKDPCTLDRVTRAMVRHAPSTAGVKRRTSEGCSFGPVRR